AVLACVPLQPLVQSLVATVEPGTVMPSRVKELGPTEVNLPAFGRGFWPSRSVGVCLARVG
ncbi:MAG: hypothetical protein ACYCZP_03840, partial [Acidimicrobiales bacterium]